MELLETSADQNTCGGGPQFCFVIGRPRSGTTVFEAMLDSHPQVCCMGEVLNEPNDETFFNYLKRQVGHDPDILLPSRSISNFQRYMMLCSERAQILKPGSKIVVFNVKYDQAHLIVEPFWQVPELPWLFRFMRDSGCRVIDIRRDNIPALIISNCVAIGTNIYHSTDLRPGECQRAQVRIDPDYFVDEIGRMTEGYRLVSRHFGNSGKYLQVLYENMFDIDPPHLFLTELLYNLSEFFGIINKFDPIPRLQKLLSDDLFGYVSNADELRSLLLKKQPEIPVSRIRKLFKTFSEPRPYFHLGSRK